LELVREGKMEMRQDEVFAPLYLRGRAQGIRAVEVAS
ncbi:MAG: segregation/condensation protein A, partial [Mesorhizobium sp.]